MTLQVFIAVVVMAFQLSCALLPTTRLSTRGFASGATKALPTTRLSTRGFASGATRGFALGAKGPRALHQAFTIEKATKTLLDELDVKNWPTWSTQGSAKYVTGEKSPLKVYDGNELSYIISGSMEITNAETGQSSLVQAGNFVTFPDGFKCYWFVKEPVLKNWYLY